VNNAEIILFLNACLSECENTWRDKRKVMQECYDRYLSYRDHSKKKSWQHKIVVPAVYPAIKGASGLIKRILMKSDEFFKFVPERRDNASQNAASPAGAPAAGGAPAALPPAGGMPPGGGGNGGMPAAMPTATAPAPVGTPVEDKMDNFARAFTKKVRYHIDQCDFIDKFGEAVESAFVMFYGCLKFTPVRCDETKVVWALNPQAIDKATGLPAPRYEFLREISERGKLRCEVVNPLLLYFPVDRSYIIEESRVQLSDLLYNEEGIKYEKKELNKLKREDYVNADQSEAEQARRLMLRISGENKNKYRKEVVLHTFYGTITQEDGTVVKRDARFIVANKKYVILKPEASPYWLRKHPYVFITPLKTLVMVIGNGMVDGIRPVINALDNIINMAGDKALFSLLAPTEINVDALKDPEQAEGGLTPGKLYKTKGPLGQAMHQIQQGDIAQGTFILADLFRSFIQNYTGWTEFIQGMPTAKGDVTATEVNRKTEASTMQFENIASSIEKGGIVESVEIVRDFTVQYFMDPAFNPETYDMFEQEGVPLDILPEAERFAFVDKRYPIRVKGLSAFFDAERRRRDMVELFELLAKVPAIAVRLNLEEFLSRVLNTYDEPNPEDLILKQPPIAPGTQLDPKTGMPIPVPQSPMDAATMMKMLSGMNPPPGAAAGGPAAPDSMLPQ